MKRVQKKQGATKEQRRKASVSFSYLFGKRKKSFNKLEGRDNLPPKWHEHNPVIGWNWSSIMICILFINTVCHGDGRGDLKKNHTAQNG